MNNYGYLIVIMAIVSIVMGQQRFIGHRPKSKFRPRPEWFGEMLPQPEPVVYEEQNDQPFEQNNSPFKDFILEDYEITDSTNVDGKGKLPRNIFREAPTFQNICPFNSTQVDTNLDPRFDWNYEYIPKKFTEIKCSFPYDRKHQYAFNKNLVCRNQARGECIPMTKTMHFVKRLKVPAGVATDNCWQHDTLTISSGCECMWPKHSLGDILHAHINFDDE